MIPIGLQLNQVTTELDQQIVRSRNRYNNVIRGIAITLGVIAGISTIALSIFKFVTVPRLGNRWSPVYSKYSGLYIMSVIFGWAVPGYATFGAIIGIGSLIRNYKIKQLNLFKNQLANKYEAQALLSGEDLVNFLKRIDSIHHQQLVTHMNFDQLGYANQVLGEKTFARLISSVNKEQHKQWEALLSLPQQHKADEVIELLGSHEIRQIIKENPLFAIQLKKRLSHYPKYAGALLSI